MNTYFLRLALGALLLLGAARGAVAQPVDNLLLITYDGLRWQELFGGIDEKFLHKDIKSVKNHEALRKKYWAETPEARRELLLPFFWNVIAKEGQIYGDTASGSPCLVLNRRNFSYPGYNELLTGAPDDFIFSNDKRDNRNLSVLEFLDKQARYSGKVAAFCSWDVFPFILNARSNKIPVSAGWDGRILSKDPKRQQLFEMVQAETPRYWEGVRFDTFTHHAAEEYINDHKPKVIYVGYGETDDWAHSGRYDLYIESARQTDAFIQRLWELLQSKRQYRGRTALVISTDHGRGDNTETWTSHGEKLPETDHIWMAVMGPGVAPRGIVRDTPTTQGQFAATGAALMGLDFTAARPEAAKPLPYK